jgi:hypothetical protein
MVLDLVSLDNVEVHRSMLKPTGDALPSEWLSQPILGVSEPPDAEEFGPFPETGWRLISNNTDAAVFAAPASASPSLWWVLHLMPVEGGWVGQASWPEEPTEVHSPLLELGWPDPPIQMRRGELASLRVRIRRSDRQPISASDVEKRHVVGHLMNLETGELLAYEPWQAFTGFGPDLEFDDEGAALLPVTLITTGVEALSSGNYGLTATLVALSLTTPLGAMYLQ